ncbi:MAG: ABC transporter ATP-binding protein [Alphaproteobacteria bacterium]
MSAPATIEVATTGDTANPPLLEVKDLKRYFQVRLKDGLLGRKAALKAVDGVSFTIKRGESLGIVGESGCGKSTMAKLVLNITTPTSGEIIFDGHSIAGSSPAQWRALRRDMQFVFQDPLGALDPRMRVIDQTSEPLLIHKIGTAAEQREQAAALLISVRLKEHTFDRYPHELSGGQRQRVVLARALILKPQLLVCDEPVSALDVSIQAQVINLLAELREQLGLTLMFISHDLSVVRHVCDRVAVMYLGRIVELAEGDSLFENPGHPYTQALLSAIPVPEPGTERTRIFLAGDPPSPIDVPSGCRFHTRCPAAKPVCAERDPQLKPLRDGQQVACHVAHGEA